MESQIDMVANENILRLHGQGVSNRGIARLLQLDRGKVARCIRLRADPKPAGVPAGISASLCAPFHDQIVRGVEAGLTAQRIFQDLRGDHGFGGAYDTGVVGDGNRGRRKTTDGGCREHGRNRRLCVQEAGGKGLRCVWGMMKAGDFGGRAPTWAMRDGPMTNCGRCWPQT